MATFDFIRSNEKRIGKIHPVGRNDLPLQGILATCSPKRPNPVPVSAVELLDRTAGGLRVQGLEAANETPVIDINPYIQHYYCLFHHILLKLDFLSLGVAYSDTPLDINSINF